MKRLLTACIMFCAFAFQAPAQTPYFSQYKIEYEKTVAAPALVKELSPEWYEFVKDRLPKEFKTYFNFTGNENKSVYKAGREVQFDPQMDWLDFAGNNIVYNDYNAGTTITSKNIYDAKFLIHDSLLNIRWKLTDDTRSIAGFECHKAIGVVFDTVTVFAFYAEQLLLPGGPEGIQGLPGQILGLGIPRLHTTWFATKVEVNDVPVNQIVPVTKGKPQNRKDMGNALQEAMRNWDTYGQKMKLAAML